MHGINVPRENVPVASAEATAVSRIKFAVFYPRASFHLSAGRFDSANEKVTPSPDREGLTEKIISDDRPIDTLADFCRSMNPQSDPRLYFRAHAMRLSA